MTASLESFRPKLTKNARLRVRSDGSCGVYDDVTGKGREVAHDQAALLELIDGKRSVPEIVEAHYAAHRFVPFAALDDLLRSLDAEGLLESHPANEKPRLNWMRRLNVQLLHPGLPGAPIFSLIVCVAAIVTAVMLRPSASAELSPWDVLLAYPGAVLALSLRQFFAAAAVRVFGERVSHLEVGVTAGVLYLGPDPDAYVLLDRARRARVHVLSLLGGGVAYVIAHKLSMGLAFGAAAALICDLCPFAPTSAGRLIATVAGKVDLREHARAYLDRRILRRVTSSSTFEGEGSLIVSALLSLAWLGLVARLSFTKGWVGVLLLLATGVDEAGAKQTLCYVGAALLALLMPVSLVALVATIVRAMRSLMPPQSSSGGTRVEAESRASLTTIPLFARLPPAEVEALAKAGEELRYEPGHAIVMQGEAGDRFFAILSGRVVVELEADSGLVREVARLGPGDCFGEMALLEGGVRSATVRAVELTTVLALSKTAFDRIRQGLDAEHLSAILRAAAALKKSAFFGGMASDRLSAIALKLEPRRVQRGDIIIREGEAGDDFFLVSEGALEVLDAHGQTMATLGPGDHFGEVALLRDVPRTATVRAMAQSLILALNKQSFLNAISQDLLLSSRIEAFAAERAQG